MVAVNGEFNLNQCLMAELYQTIQRPWAAFLCERTKSGGSAQANVGRATLGCVVHQSRLALAALWDTPGLAQAGSLTVVPQPQPLQWYRVGKQVQY